MIPSNLNTTRPADKELYKKLREATDSVKADTWVPADPTDLKGQFDDIEAEFGFDTTLREDQRAILLGALGEIVPDHYAGLRPPMRAYKPKIKGKELFAFSWKSSYFGGVEMYFKFCVIGKGDSIRAAIVSIHRSEP